jgi:nucleoside-diphosphate-sugar epimerase
MADAPIIAISGASGLFGSAFLAKYSENLHVTKSLQLQNLADADIYREIESLSAFGTQTFLHLAWSASSSKENYRFSEENFDALRKTVLLKEACSQMGIKFVGIGTVVDKVGITESYYQLAKFTCRQMFRREIEEEKITWVRPHYVFNDDSWPSFLQSDKSLPVTILNNSPRDFIHLDDVISGLFLILQKKILGEIDLGSGWLTKPSELCEAFGKEFIIEQGETGGVQLEASPTASSHPRLSQYWVPTKTHALLKEKQR